MSTAKILFGIVLALTLCFVAGAVFAGYNFTSDVCVAALR